jgi:hypothetical protein
VRQLGLACYALDPKRGQQVYESSMAATSEASVALSEKPLAREILTMVTSGDFDSRSEFPPTIMKDEEIAVAPEPEWKPTVHELAIMLTLSTTSLMISLDASIVVTTIGVCMLMLVHGC